MNAFSASLSCLRKSSLSQQIYFANKGKTKCTRDTSKSTWETELVPGLSSAIVCKYGDRSVQSGSVDEVKL